MTTWDPANKDASITLSNANLTATSSVNGSWKSVIATGSGKTSAKWYFRVKSTLALAADFVGAAFCTNTESTAALIGSDANGWTGYKDGQGGSSGGVWHNNANIVAAGLPPMSPGDYIVAAYDATNGGLYFTTMTAAGVLNTNWNSASANPSTATGGLAVTAGTALLPGASFLNTGDSLLLDTTSTISAPTLSGFQPYDATGTSGASCHRLMLGVGCGIWFARKIEENPIVKRRSLLLPHRMSQLS